MSGSAFIPPSKNSALLFQRKWYRNFLMKGFHLVVLLAAGPGIRDTQVMFFVILLLPSFILVL